MKCNAAGVLLDGVNLGLLDDSAESFVVGNNGLSLAVFMLKHSRSSTTNVDSFCIWVDSNHFLDCGTLLDFESLGQIIFMALLIMQVNSLDCNKLGSP